MTNEQHTPALPTDGEQRIPIGSATIRVHRPTGDALDSDTDLLALVRDRLTEMP